MQYVISYFKWMLDVSCNLRLNKFFLPVLFLAPLLLSEGTPAPPPKKKNVARWNFWMQPQFVKVIVLLLQSCLIIFHNVLSVKEIEKERKRDKHIRWHRCTWCKIMEGAYFLLININSHTCHFQLWTRSVLYRFQYRRSLQNFT